MQFIFFLCETYIITHRILYIYSDSVSSFFFFEQGIPDLSEFGDAYDVEFGLGPDQPPTSAVVKKELQRKIIYHMSPQEVNKKSNIVFIFPFLIFYK